MLIASEREQRLGITNESGCWPTPKQELLLKAALLHGPEALYAWEQWRKIADIEVLDFGSHRMLPKLYRNLLLHHVSRPELSKFRSVYRYYWYQNETLFHRAKELLKSFRAQGIDTMVLKGAAMITLYYKDSGVRPMQDFDLVVPPSHAVRAMKLLASHGWRSRLGSPLERIPSGTLSLMRIRKLNSSICIGTFWASAGISGGMKDFGKGRFQRLSPVNLHGCSMPPISCSTFALTVWSGTKFLPCDGLRMRWLSSTPIPPKLIGTVSYG
jgi:hypothetical protein